MTATRTYQRHPLTAKQLHERAQRSAATRRSNRESRENSERAGARGEGLTHVAKRTASLERTVTGLVQQVHLLKSAAVEPRTDAPRGDVADQIVRIMQGSQNPTVVQDALRALTAISAMSQGPDAPQLLRVDMHATSVSMDATVPAAEKTT